MTEFNESNHSDLPPRTWRSWWLAWPKWFRIGAWASSIVVLLHIGVAARVYFGLFEPSDLLDMEKRGIQFKYRWYDEETYNRLLSQSDFAAEIYAGLIGKSWWNVTEIWLNDRGSDADIRLIAKRATNLQVLQLQRSAVSPSAISLLSGCKNLQVLDLSDTDTNDDAVASLVLLKNLSQLKLSGTLVTNVGCDHLALSNSLRGIDLSDTDVSPAQIYFRLSSGPGIAPVVTHINVRDDLYPNSVIGRISWSDGTKSANFLGELARFQVEWRPLKSHDEVAWKYHSYHESVGGFLRGDMKYDTFREDGEYRFRLKLGTHESQPVILTLEAGRLLSRSLEFQMSCTKSEALRQIKSRSPSVQVSVFIIHRRQTQLRALDHFCEHPAEGSHEDLSPTRGR